MTLLKSLSFVALTALAATQPAAPPMVMEVPAPPVVRSAPPSARSAEEFRQRREKMLACQRAYHGQDYLPQPAIWQLSDEDTTITLFGTLHRLPIGFEWRSAQFDELARSADVLVTETGDVPFAERRTQFEAMFSPAEGEARYPKVVERLEGERRAKWQGMAAVMPETAVAQADKSPTWLVAMVVAGVANRNRAVTTGTGVEDQIYPEFRRAKKKIERIEDPKTVSDSLRTVPAEVQARMLATALDQVGNKPTGFDLTGYANRWARGEGFEVPLDEASLPPELAHRLLDLRNAAWVDEVEQRLKRKGHVLIAVGAGHLHGKGSLIERLEARGLKVTRISPIGKPPVRTDAVPAPKTLSECARAFLMRPAAK